MQQNFIPHLFRSVSILSFSIVSFSLAQKLNPEKPRVKNKEANDFLSPELPGSSFGGFISALRSKAPSIAGSVAGISVMPTNRPLHTYTLLTEEVIRRSGR